MVIFFLPLELVLDSQKNILLNGIS